MMTIFNNWSDNVNSLSDNGTEIKEFNTCRICYDDDTNECILIPCNCVGSHSYIHKSCLERWLSVSGSSECDICKYTFKTFRRQRSLVECFGDKNNCQEYSSQLMVMILIILIWIAMVIILVIRTHALLDSQENNLIINTLTVVSIAITLVITLVFWTKDIFQICSMWWELNTEICLDQDYFNQNDTITSITTEV